MDTTPLPVQAGQRWYGPRHSAWMVFDGDDGLFDLWCFDRGQAAGIRQGMILTGLHPHWIEIWLDPERP